MSYSDYRYDEVHSWNDEITSILVPRTCCEWLIEMCIKIIVIYNIICDGNIHCILQLQMLPNSLKFCTNSLHSLGHDRWQSMIWTYLSLAHLLNLTHFVTMFIKKIGFGKMAYVLKEISHW